MRVRDSDGPVLRRTGRKLRLCLALDAWEVIALAWRRDRALPAAAAAGALRETLTFDLGSGRSWLRLEGADGAVYDVCDLSGRRPAADPLLDALGRDESVREALAAAFAEAWGGPLPFAPAELDAERAALMAAFRGFDRDFYDAVPLRSGGCGVAREFRRAARALRRAEDLPAAVAGCGLPQMKSLRRALFARPALLFYPAELRTLRAALPDPNCFCALLAEGGVFTLLAELHSFPGAADFYIDLGRAVGGPTLLRLLRERRCSLGMSAMAYAAMDPRGRRRERRAWQGSYEALAGRCVPFHDTDALGYSIPVPREADSAVPALSAAGGCSFQRLGSVREFARAGAELGNCLAELPCYFSGGTVVVVRREGAAVAAAELRGRRIVQALGMRNRPIPPDTPLGRALGDWAGRYGLSPAEENDLP